MDNLSVHCKPRRAWPERLMMSGAMDMALNLIDWPQEGPQSMLVEKAAC